MTPLPDNVQLAPTSAAVPTPGAHRAPALLALSPSLTSSYATLFSVCLWVDFGSRTFSLQTPVECSESLAGCWAVRARANPLSLWVWHFTLMFALPGVGLANPVDLERRAVVYWTQSLPASIKQHTTTWASVGRLSAFIGNLDRRLMLVFYEHLVDEFF